MKYSDLKTVLTIYREQSFTSAAKRLYISQPAISQTVAQLEKELGILLFIRNKGKITPTPACERFVSYASDISELWEKLEQEMKTYMPSNYLRIGTTSFYFRFLSYANKPQFHPDLKIKYNIIEDTAANIERMTSEGNVDFCFTRAPLRQAALKSEPLFTEEILFALPIDHPVCQRYPFREDAPFPFIDLSNFSSSDFVMVNNPQITPLCYKMCQESGYTPKVTLQPMTWEHVITSICSGGGVGFLSIVHIKKEDYNRLRFFRIQSKYAKMEHVVAYRASKELTSQARLFIKFFQQYIQDCLETLDMLNRVEQTV